MAYSNNRSTFFCPAGTKWYWEFVPTTNYNYASCGITTNSHEWDINPGGGNSTPSGHGVGIYGAELDVDGTRGVATVTAWASGDIIGFAYDVDDNNLKYYINGSLSYTYTSVPASTDGPYSPSFGDFGGAAAATINVNFGADSSFGGLKTAQGNQDSNGMGDFYYEPPTDYLALCSSNLASPEIALPEENFETVLFTGTGATRTVATSFQSDFAWFKQRGGATNHLLYNSTTGGTNALASNTTAAEAQHGDAVLTFNSANIQIAGTDTGGLNGDTESMVLWNWKAGTSVSGTTGGAGTGTAYSGSASATAGFSIIKYVGNSTAGHGIPHHLGVAPEMFIVKNRDDAGTGWMVYHKDLTSYLYFIALDDNGAEVTGVSNDRWYSVPDATYNYLQEDLDVNEVNEADNYIMYSFAGIEGYSKVGSYVGNGNADGNFLYTGFKPALLLVKNIDTASRNWTILDNKRNTFNPEDEWLYPNLTDATWDASSYPMDFTASGFKIRHNGTYFNTDDDSYIYIAFAESPFKYSNAR